MFLKALRQRDVVEVVERVDGRTQTLVIFFFNEQVVERLVDCLIVVVLDIDIVPVIITSSLIHSKQI